MKIADYKAATEELRKFNREIMGDGHWLNAFVKAKARAGIYHIIVPPGHYKMNGVPLTIPKERVVVDGMGAVTLDLKPTQPQLRHEDESRNCSACYDHSEVSPFREESGLRTWKPDEAVEKPIRSDLHGSKAADTLENLENLRRRKQMVTDLIGSIEATIK